MSVANRLRWVLAALAALLPATAQPASAQTLTVGLSSEPTAVDPHYLVSGPNISLALHIFDTLVRQDERQQLAPGLAESWSAVDPTTWEFKLRRGVRFHDGAEFTAEDVAASLRRAPAVPNSPGTFGIYTRAVREIAIVDPYTIRLKTAEPYPLLPRDLSVVAIVSRKAEKATTQDFNTGTATIGTGPFRFVEWRPGDRFVLRRNDAYWRGPPQWESAVLRTITNEPARVAALLSGQADIIEAVPTTDIPGLRARPDVTLAQIASARLIYFHLDSFNDRSPFVTDTAGRPLERNPLKDPRVRLAISKAINRTAIVERIMDGAAVAAGQLLPDGMYGTTPDLKPEPFDPDGARRLLAEAGYPDGFGITLHGPNNRFPNDERILQAVGPMLSRIGIAAKVEPLPYNVFLSRAQRYEFSMYLRSWLSETGEASGPLRGMLATVNPDRGTGSNNGGRYSNPEFDRVLAEALRTIDDGARERLLRRATEIGIRDTGIVPLHYQVAVWAMKRGLAYVPRSDAYTLAADVRRP